MLIVSGGCKKSDPPVETNYAGKLANYSLLKEYSAQDVSQMIATSTDVKAYGIEFYTTDINGQLIVVSGFTDTLSEMFLPPWAYYPNPALSRKRR